MKFSFNKNIKKLGLILGVATVLTSFSSTAFAKGYVFYLPKYMGVKQDPQSAATKYTSTGKGYNDNYEVTGAGSYAMDYYMSNSKNERRGDYKTIDSGYSQTFNNWGEGGGNYNYYMTGMNYSSVSSDVITRGNWSPDPK